MDPTQDLKLQKKYGGFVFLAEDARGIPWLNPHRHDALELNLVIRGAVTYVIGDSSHTFKAGELFWLFPKQIHQAVERTPDSQYYVASFTPDLIRKSAISAAYKPLLSKNPPDKTTLHCKLNPSDFDEACRLLNRVLSEGLDADVLNREAGFGVSADFQYEYPDPDFLNATLAHLLIFFWKIQQQSMTPNSAAKLHPAVLHALQLLKEGPNAKKLKDLAHASGITPNYLSRLFNLELGVSITDYKNTLRMDRAREIYQASPQKITLSELCFRAGFKSYMQFYRMCQIQYGRDPKEVFK